MIYKLLLTILPLPPFLAILAAIGCYLLVKNHGSTPVDNKDGSTAYEGEADVEQFKSPFNPFATNEDSSDMINGPNGHRGL